MSDTIRHPRKAAGHAPDKLDELPLYELASIIRADWRTKDGKPNVWYGAAPYLDALDSLETVDDNYGLDTGDSIVIYFLANAAQWRGETARAVKAELKRRSSIR